MTVSPKQARRSLRGGWIPLLIAVLPRLSLASLPSDPRAFPRFTDSFAEVDEQMELRELMRARGDTTFAISLERALRDHAKLQVPSLGRNEQLFSMPDSPVEVSLISHPQCMVSQASLKTTIGSSTSRRTVDLANEFSRQLNDARELALFSDSGAARLEGWDKAMHLYSKLMGCLAYTESLTTADQEVSDSVARRVSPKGYSRPSGVLFYKDPEQTLAASQLNIGMFQFSPDPSGNILACIENWNAAYPKSKFPENISKSGMIRSLGEESQRFNAYCGVDKILQMYHIQANTASKAKTHPSNLLKRDDGKGSVAKDPSDRCVSLYFNSKSYNHFGPLQNSTGNNLYRVLSCALM